MLEAKVTGLGKLSPSEICERFTVDPPRRELVAKDAPPRDGRRRRTAPG